MEKVVRKYRRAREELDASAARGEEHWKRVVDDSREITDAAIAVKADEQGYTKAPMLPQARVESSRGLC